MHEWMGWGWGGMFLGPLFMIVWLALLVAACRAGACAGSEAGALARRRHRRTAREILDERYARGEIDREEYSAGARTSTQNDPEPQSRRRSLLPYVRRPPRQRAAHPTYPRSSASSG